jgi:hypothetical protein
MPREAGPGVFTLVQRMISPDQGTGWLLLVRRLAVNSELDDAGDDSFSEAVPQLFHSPLRIAASIFDHGEPDSLLFRGARAENGGRYLIGLRLVVRQ